MQTRSSIEDIWGPRTGFHGEGQWPRSGIQWPCNEQYPDGKERLYGDFRFPIGYEDCGDFGHDLETGGHVEPLEYKAKDPRGKAWLKAADYRPPNEEPDEEYPFALTTGRVVYQFHTRTKTGRAPELQAAAPEAFVQLSEEDARRLGIADGDSVQVTSRRATVRAKAQVGDILPGHVFIPFHYGYRDDADSIGHGPDGRAHAANELTLTAWDVVSKQPSFKYAAVKVVKAGHASLVSRVASAASLALDRASELADVIAGSTRLVERSHMSDYLGFLSDAHEEFAAACADLAEHHREDAEIREGAKVIADFSRKAVEGLRPFREKYGERHEKEPHALCRTLLPKARAGGFGLLRDLHALHILAADAHVSTTIVNDAARELRDDELDALCRQLYAQNQRQQAWGDTMIKESSAQSVAVPS